MLKDWSERVMRKKSRRNDDDDLLPRNFHAQYFAHNTIPTKTIANNKKLGDCNIMWSEKNKAQKLDLYFSSLEASTSNSGINSSSIELLGGGHFRKCGRFFESWKKRSYFVYSNAVLIYFENNLPKNIINIDNVRIEDGDENMVQKSGVKRGLSRSGTADINKDDVVSGGQIQENNGIIDEDSEMRGIPIILTLQNDSRERVKIVFETLTEAQKFCLLLKCGSQSNNAFEFVQRKQWFSVVTAFDGKSPHPFLLVTSPQRSIQIRMRSTEVTSQS
jgi:hypothetical protein